ncbi:MAG TPA: hypothetical protein IAC49_06925 [Candidatus Ventricola intestinavium]|nr:hypothetical protein [Candidatus Ventricola intestinavium]
MKLIRPLSALLVCAALSSPAAGVLAAPDASEAPVFEIASPENGVNSGFSTQLTVTASLPGFLTLSLYDSSGLEVATLCDYHEVHTEENFLLISAVDDSGEPLDAGTYTVSGTMVSQFGVASSTVTHPLTVNAPVVSEEESTAPESSGTQGTDEGAASTDSSSTGSSSSTSASASTPDVAYSAGSTVVGAEGYAIGVGVGDIVPQEDAGYWGLTASASDAEIWAALTRTMIGVDVGESESAYIYDSPEEGRERLGTVSGISQGLNVLSESDGWALVEAYRNEDGAFVRGYIRSNKLRVVEPNTTYGIVIDKATQTLTVFKDGERIGSCSVSTGLPTSKYLHRETPAGEFITVTRRGTTEYYGNGYCKYTIRINGSYHLEEIPTTRRNGSDFSMLEGTLGQKATRGNICIAHDASADGGINAEWIWNMTDENKKVKVLIFDDKERTAVPVGE